MAMVGVVTSFWQPVQTDSQPKSFGLVFSRRPLGAILHSSNEPGELSQWLCHDDSAINIVLDIIIIINIGKRLKLLLRNFNPLIATLKLQSNGPL